MRLSRRFIGGGSRNGAAVFRYLKGVITSDMIALTEQEKRLLGLVDAEARSLGLEVVRLRVQGGKRPVIQIMIDRTNGTPSDVEDCANLSRALNPVFEEHDPLPEAYRLEVSTPGIDRPLTRIGDFGPWVGHAAKIELTMPLDGRRRFSGVITNETEDGQVSLLLDDETELVAGVHEMSKASLLLTDQLIDAARERGQLPPQAEDDDGALEGFEIDETDDEEDEASSAEV